MIREALTLDGLNALSPAQAAALLAARRLEGGGDGDEGVLEAWLQHDSAHGRAWDGAQRALGVFDDADDDELLQAMRAAARGARPAAPQWPRMAAAAAAVLVVAGAGLLVYAPTAFRPGAASSQAGAPAAKVLDYATARGERKQLVLADGSRVTLDTDSLVRVAFTPGRRSLRLMKGRAAFDVRHDAGRPFAVAAGGREVIAVGTRFDVRLDPGQVRVVLVQGRVSVSSAGLASPPVLLSAGQQLVAPETGPPVVGPADLDEAAGWERGYLTFRNQTLAAAAAEMNRYGGDRLVVRDRRVAQLRVSGMFRAGEAARFGRTLAQVHPVRVVRTSPGELEIVPAG